LVLHQFVPWISITAQVLDGPPGDTARRLSSFLLIPVGVPGRDLHIGRQKTVLAGTFVPAPGCRTAMGIPED
jgi:hypothetical protein